MVTRVTIDTNVCSLIGDPVGHSDRAAPGTAEQVRRGIEKGNIRAFVSEASAFVEFLSSPQKLEYLAVAGTRQARPIPDPRSIAEFRALAELGVHMLHAPLIGAEKFFDEMPWALDEVYSQEERIRRFDNFARQYPLQKPLVTLGSEMLKSQPPVPQGRTFRAKTGFSMELRLKWAVALKREWHAADGAERKKLRKKIAPMISEWCDELIVSSHVAYGNDVLCTLDRGKGAGSHSLLHHLNRASLEASGVKIISPEEMAAL